MATFVVKMSKFTDQRDTKSGKSSDSSIVRAIINALRYQPGMVLLANPAQRQTSQRSQ
jgi:hypothetical protein